MIKKSAIKKIVLILSIIIISTLISSINKCFALGDITDISGTWGEWKPSVTGGDELGNKLQPIIVTILQLELYHQK